VHSVHEAIGRKEIEQRHRFYVCHSLLLWHES